MEITKVVELPSRGYFGGVAQVEVRNMKTKEEKILNQVNDVNMFRKLVQSCIVEPKNMDIKLLHGNDILYLVYEIRNLTYGNTYTIRSMCPNCGTMQDFLINISDFELNFLDIDSLEEKLTLELPVSKDIIKLKLLSLGDTDKIDRQVKLRCSRTPGLKEDDERYDQLLENVVKEVNGETLNVLNGELRNYLNDLHSKDVNTILNRLQEIKIGLDRTVLANCPNCQLDTEVFGTMCPEFFHPSI